MSRASCVIFSSVVAVLATCLGLAATSSPASSAQITAPSLVSSVSSQAPQKLQRPNSAASIRRARVEARSQLRQLRAARGQSLTAPSAVGVRDYGFNDAYVDGYGLAAYAFNQALSTAASTQAAHQKLGEAAWVWLAAATHQNETQAKVTALEAITNRSAAQNAQLTTLRRDLTAAKSSAEAKLAQLTHWQWTHAFRKAASDQALSVWQSTWASEASRINALLFQSVAGGSNTIRYVVGWDAVQPHAGGGFSFWYHDYLYQAALAFGLRPIIVLNSAPCWAHPSVACSSLGNAHYSIRPDPAYLGQFTEYARQVTARYPAARAIEVWNEPNAAKFWGPKPNGRDYAQLLHAGWSGVKAANPGMAVAMGGPSPAADLSWSTWINQALQAGAGKWSNILALHPYPQTKPLVQNSLDQVDKAQALLRAHNVGGKPIWITEIGLSTDPDARQLLRVTPAEQADGLVKIHNGLRARGIQMMIIHRLKEVRHSNGWESGLALVKHNDTPKPAFCALRKARGKPC